MEFRCYASIVSTVPAASFIAVAHLVLAPLGRTGQAEAGQEIQNSDALEAKKARQPRAGHVGSLHLFQLGCDSAAGASPSRKDGVSVVGCTWSHLLFAAMRAGRLVKRSAARRTWIQSAFPKPSHALLGSFLQQQHHEPCTPSNAQSSMHGVTLSSNVQKGSSRRFQAFCRWLRVARLPDQGLHEGKAARYMRHLYISLTCGAWTICADAYNACVKSYLENSGFGGTVSRVKLQLGEYYSRPFYQIEEIFLAAVHALEQCRAIGGMLWSVEFPTNTSGTNSRAGWEKATHLRPMSIGFCAPSICKTRQMPPLVEDYISNFVGFQAEIPPHSMHFVELASWEEFNIQIAVVGLDHCGTTSARMNLGLHPKVDFSTSQVPLLLEDTFFTWAIAWHLLPPKYLQKHWLEFNNARRQSSSSVLGLHNAVLWKHSIARLAIHRMNARPVLIVCSPARRVASTVMLHHSRTAETVTVDDLIRWADVESIPHLRDWRRLFGERLVVIHQEALMERQTYDKIFALLGLGPLPAGAPLSRFHVSGHHWKSSLCQSKDHAMLSQLNRTLRPWMIANQQLLQQSNQDTPSSIWQLQGHCFDRPASLLKVSTGVLLNRPTGMRNTRTARPKRPQLCFRSGKHG